MLLIGVNEVLGMYLRFLITALLWCSCEACFRRGNYARYSMDKACNKANPYTITPSPAAHLFTSFLYYYPRDMNCSVLLDGGPGHGVQVELRQLRVKYSTNCTQDQLTISSTDSMGNITVLTPPNGLCGTQLPRQVWYETPIGGKIMVQFMSGAQNSRSRGFELVATVYTNGSRHCSGFKCDDNKCISSDLTCDAYYNCKDKKDESNSVCYRYRGCYGLCRVLVGLGAAIFTIFLLIIAIVLVLSFLGYITCCLCCRKKTSRHETLDLSQTAYHVNGRDNVAFATSVGAGEPPPAYVPQAPSAVGYPGYPTPGTTAGAAPSAPLMNEQKMPDVVT